jgi:hypothetical protein
MPDNPDDIAKWLALLGTNMRLLDEALRNAALRDQHATSPSQHRLAALQQLQAFIGFMDADASWRAYKMPLTRLALALLDLDNGRIAPMLQTEPRDVRGGPAVSLPEAIHRAHAAYIADGLMKHAGLSRDNAAKWVAAKLTLAGHDVSFHTIIDWRKDAANPHKNELAHKSYSYLQQAGQEHWHDPLPYAETLIKKLIAEMQKGE